MDIKEINEKIQRESAFVDLLTMELSKVIVGQKYMVERLMIGLLSNGHILLEGVPGLAKTLMSSWQFRVLWRYAAAWQFCL
jgi:MoxR-like ATPase